MTWLAVALLARLHPRSEWCYSYERVSYLLQTQSWFAVVRVPCGLDAGHPGLQRKRTEFSLLLFKSLSLFYHVIQQHNVQIHPSIIKKTAYPRHQPHEGRKSGRLHRATCWYTDGTEYHLLAGSRVHCTIWIWISHVLQCCRYRENTHTLVWSMMSTETIKRALKCL